MSFKVKNLDLPEELIGIINAINNPDIDKPPDFEINKYNEKNYLSQFNRLIDPVLLSMFYGLYISKKLPGQIDQTNVNFEKKEFGADISGEMNIFNHLLFCLWLKENGFPNESENILKYRTELYSFLGNILNKEYVEKQVIPLYIIQSNNLDNFNSEMRESGFIEFKNAFNSPEYLAKMFQTAQEEFESTVIRPLFSKITPSTDPLTNPGQFAAEFKKLIQSGESGYREFKSSALWSKNYDKKEIDVSKSPEIKQFGKNASKFIIARAMASFLNTDGGNLIIGVKENKVTGKDEFIGVDSEFNKLKDKTVDGYRRMIVDEIIRVYFDENTYNYMHNFFKITFPSVEGKTLCWIQVKKSTEPVFVGTNSNDMFFIRTDAETRNIDGKELAEYIKNNFS